MLLPWLPKSFALPLFAKRWSLNAHELTKSASGTVKAKNRAKMLAGPKQMQFSGWQLAHAVRQAESNLLPPWLQLNWSTLGFLAEYGYLLSRSNTEFSLADGAIGALDDFVQSSFAGRLGQGIGLLWMRQQRYTFSTRFQRLCATAQPPISLYTVSGKKIPSPDMAFAGPAGKALLEAKASFIHPSNSKSSLVQPLNKGLKQLAGWGAKFNPAFGNSFVTALQVREENDPHAEGSLLLWTDPENQLGEHGVPAGLVPTAHYAGWLHAMAAPAVASRLMGDESITEQRFRVTRIGDEWFAVRPFGLGTGNQLLATGIRWQTLKAISRLSTSWDSFDRRPAKRFPILDSFAVDEGEQPFLPSHVGEQGSYFLDGTYFGMCDYPREIASLPF